MTVLPTLEMFARFTSADGYVAAGWMLSCGWMMRGAARIEKRPIDARRARLIALGFHFASLVPLSVATWVAPAGGPTIYGGLFGTAWALGSVSAWWLRRTGRPLL